jgi:hypothetical protein
MSPAHKERTPGQIVWCASSKLEKRGKSRKEGYIIKHLLTTLSDMVAKTRQKAKEDLEQAAKEGKVSNVSFLFR